MRVHRAVLARVPDRMATTYQEPPAPVAGLAGARVDLKVEVKARKWLIDVAVVCPATKAVRSRTSTQGWRRRLP